MKRPLVVAILAVLSLLAAAPGQAEVYLVRHADRDGDHDRLASPAGTDRALALAERLAGVGIVAIFSTETHRTQATVWPLAERLGLPVQGYDGVRELRTRLREVRRRDPRARVLVVGHSNTVPEIVTRLGAALPAGLPLTRQGWLHHDDYDNLVILSFEARDRVRARHATYGSATAPP
ncbi:MAG: histidine phosphatase family protein [Thermoanaerobaculia bacterium]|nr:histidine phosphatase family protein [Thermoanaerobaculia bacterium]